MSRIYSRRDGALPWLAAPNLLHCRERTTQNTVYFNDLTSTPAKQLHFTQLHWSSRPHSATLTSFVSYGDLARLSPLSSLHTPQRLPLRVSPVLRRCPVL